MFGIVEKYRERKRQKERRKAEDRKRIGVIQQYVTEALDHHNIPYSWINGAIITDSGELWAFDADAGTVNRFSGPDDFTAWTHGAIHRPDVFNLIAREITHRPNRRLTYIP